MREKIVSVSFLTDVALLNFDLSRLISCLAIAGEGNSRIRRARIKLELNSDCHAIFKNPPDIVKVKVEDYSQSFNNFNGTTPIEFTFDHNVQVTTAEDYTQPETRRFEVSVNANIPVV